MFCEKCGKQLIDGATFCDECGTAVTKETNWLEHDNKIILLLLLIFGGKYGLHNFAMGETKKGIVKIVLSIPFILAGLGAVVLSFIDAVKIAKGTYKIDPNSFF